MALAFFLVVVLPAGPAVAGSIWTGANSNLWNDSLNWNGTVPANGDTLYFDSSSAANLNTNNDMAGLTNLSFDIDKSGVTITGNAIGLGSAGITADSLGSPILSVDLSQPGDTTYTVGSWRTITLNGVVSGAGGIVKAGGGDLVLNGVNTYTGGTQLNAGIVSVGSNDNLGDTSGGLSFNGGTLKTTADIVSYRSVVVGSGGGTFDTDGNHLCSWGTMTGTGSLTVAGGGMVSLGTTAGTFDGDLIVNDNSTLRMTTDNSLGTTAGNLTLNSGILTFGNSITTDEAIVLGAGGGTISTFSTLTETLSGIISGAGALTTTGGGTLILTGTNTYTGGTTVADGTLQGDTDSLQGDIVNNSTVTFVGTTTGTYAGVISGTGNVIQNSGATTLTGANTYSGGTRVNGGYLTGTTTSLQGDIVVNGNLTFDQGFDGTFSGDISGTASAVPFTGGLTKQGSGTVTLTGTNTYNGGTRVQVGTLQGDTDSLQGAIDTSLGAGVVFDQSADGTYAGVMSGWGSLSKTGAGNLTLTGANTYTGTTTIDAGTLWVNGSITGTTTVGAGGTLGGTGSVGDVTVNGIFAPGNSIGTINTGNLVFNAGSVYEVEVDAVGNSDSINVTGTVSLGNATLSVLADNGTYAAQTDYQIIENDGADAITGTFGTLTSDLAFLDPSVSYTGGDGNDVMLTLSRNDISYSEIALTDNQRAVATALEESTPGATGDMDDVITAVTGLSAEGARSAYDQMGGAGLAAFYESDLSAATRTLKTVSGRLASLRADTASTALTQWDTGPLLASNDSLATTDAGPLLFGLGNPGPLAPGADWGVWGRGLGVWGDRDGRDVAEQYDYTITGATLGMDRRLGDSLVAGVSVGYVDADLDYDQLDDSGTSRGWETALYGAWMQGPWYVNVMAAYARNDYDTKRHLSFGGIDRVAEGDFDGDVWSAYLEGGRTFDWQGLILQPLASLQVVYMDYDSYTETGAGALNLVVDDGDATSVMGSVGLRLARVMAGPDGGQVVPEARVRWAHEFNHDDRVISAGFAGAPAGTGSFRVDGGAPVRDRLILGCGLTALYNGAVGVYLNYDASLGDRALDHALSAGLRIMW